MAPKNKKRHNHPVSSLKHFLLSALKMKYSSKKQWHGYRLAFEPI